MFEALPDGWYEITGKIADYDSNNQLGYCPFKHLICISFGRVSASPTQSNMYFIGQKVSELRDLLTRCKHSKRTFKDLKISPAE